MTSEKLVYVIDIGTNSIRLMRARAEGDSVRCLDKTIRTVRTGEGVNANGYLLEAAIDRSLDVLSEYKRMAEAEGAQEVYCFATSAVRDSSNSEHCSEQSGSAAFILKYCLVRRRRPVAWQGCCRPAETAALSI